MSKKQDKKEQDAALAVKTKRLFKAVGTSSQFLTSVYDKKEKAKPQGSKGADTPKGSKIP